ncbi:hypothetical protein K8R33_03635 [archaeon]|nr:hypothetical protein [archaeon]
MFTKRELIGIFNEAHCDFSKKHKVKCTLKFVGGDEFFSISKESKLIEENLIEGVPIIVGALVKHSVKGDTVYLCEDMINQLTSDKDFVKALVMHEFYHVLFKKKLKVNSLSEGAESEVRAKQAMIKEFPELSKHIV